jgi:DNA helicase-2/ATP-dependent DNA helicase PcrA
MLSKARKTLTAFVEKNAEDMRKVEEVEARLEYPIQRATITGRVDVILRGQNGQELEVRDYKTSDEVTTTKESSLQVRLYALGLRKMGRNITRASIAYLDTGEIKPVDISKAKMDEAHSIAQGCVKAIAKGKYKAKPKKRCRCDYTHICRFVP